MSPTLTEDLQYTLSRLTPAEQNKLSGSTILLTGCSGFLGYYFLHFFKAHAKTLAIQKVIGLDNFGLGTPAWMEDFQADPLFEIRKFDIATDDLTQLEGAEKADYIIHMASIASPIYYRKYPIETLDANIWGLRRLLDFYKDKPHQGFLFYSSSEIYGDPDADHIPTSEDYRGLVSCTGPRACYDESKRFGETMCTLFAKQYDMPIRIVRPFNIYGPGMRLDDQRLPPDFAKNVLANQDLVIYSDGTPTRTFTYVADSIAGDLKILLHDRFDYFNMGSESPEITVRELADYLMEAGREICGYTGKVVFQVSSDQDYLTDNPQRRCPDLKKAQTLLGYAPTISMADGVRRFLKFLQESDAREYDW